MLIMSIFGLAACNEKSSSSSDEFVYDTSMTAVTGFSLKADKEVCANLDSVFFSIDLKNRVIFNADSLPVGTDVSKLVPIITYPSNVSGVSLNMTGGANEGSVDYLADSSAEIDFTGQVLLTITAGDGVNTRTYDVKVNVHKMNPDSLMWAPKGVGTLPSRLDAPKQQRTVVCGDRLFVLVEESDATYTLSTASSIESEAWNHNQLTIPFKPQVRTLSASSSALYILAEDGTLYTSTDGLAWTSTSAKWTAILGGWSDKVLGLREEDGETVYTQYPLDAAYTEKKIDAGFPVSGASNMLCISNKWLPLPYGLITGGRTAEGTLIGSSWAFDGVNWAELTANRMTPVEDATLLPYFMYRESSWLWYQSEHSIFMLVGGRLGNGEMNRVNWVSLNNGVIWSEAPESMQLPEDMAASCQLDGFVLSLPKTGSLDDAFDWKEVAARPKKLNYQLDDYEVSWECPYIFLFGGINASGTLDATIRRGTIARMTFVPMI